MAKKGRKKGRKRDKLATMQNAFLAMLDRELDAKQKQRDALDDEIESISRRMAAISGESMDGAAEAPVIQRRRGKIKAGTGKRGRKPSSKTKKLAALGEKLYNYLAKDKGTWFGSDAVKSALNGTLPGPVKNVWNKMNPDRQIATRGPGKKTEYQVK